MARGSVLLWYELHFFQEILCSPICRGQVRAECYNSANATFIELNCGWRFIVSRSKLAVCSMMISLAGAILIDWLLEAARCCRLTFSCSSSVMSSGAVISLRAWCSKPNPESSPGLGHWWFHESIEKLVPNIPAFWHKEQRPQVKNLSCDRLVYECWRLNGGWRDFEKTTAPDG